MGDTEGEGKKMKQLEIAYGYMVMLRNLGEAAEFRQCMKMEGWPLESLYIRNYAVKWIGEENAGVQPVAAYYGGKIDPWQMLYDRPAMDMLTDRAGMFPPRRPCVPYKSPQCWKRKSLLLLETCEYCCDNFQHKGGFGAPWCFTDYWTYEKCCQQDF